MKTKPGRIEAANLEAFAPFADQIVRFNKSPESDSAELHLFTGKNGTGKTRLLCMIMAAIGNQHPLLRRRYQASQSEVFSRGSLMAWSDASNETTLYSAGRLLGNKLVPSKMGENFGVNSTFMSIGAAFSGTSTPTIGLAFKGTNSVGNATVEALKPIVIGQAWEQLDFEQPDEMKSKVCQALANICTQSAMDSMSEGNGTGRSRSRKMKDAIEETITSITRTSFSLTVAAVEQDRLELMAIWGGTRMRLLHLPDGIRSIIGWLAACVAKLDTLLPDSPNPLEEPFFLLLDEPELHLHPEWQWKILPATQRLFPNAQIFVATHSPFVVASANEGWIHILETHPETGLVEIRDPIACQKGDTFLDAAEDILGICSWYDPETEQDIRGFKEKVSAVRKAKGEGMADLETLAAELGSHSRSLANLVGSEMAQLKRQLEVAGAKT